MVRKNAENIAQSDTFSGPKAPLPGTPEATKSLQGGQRPGVFEGSDASPMSKTCFKKGILTRQEQFIVRILLLACMPGANFSQTLEFFQQGHLRNGLEHLFEQPEGRKVQYCRKTGPASRGVPFESKKKHIF